MWSSFLSVPSIFGLAALALASWAAADYHVVNANNTVAYAPKTRWRTFSFATQNLTLITNNGKHTVDSSKCYDQNYASSCTVEDNCQFSFPFTGSGISVYVMHAGFQGITASLTIDDGQPITATLPPPTPPSYQTPKVSLFDLQYLQNADHTATISLLDWENGVTSLYFDYALINETHVELPVSPPTSSPPSSSLSAKSPAVSLITLATLQSSTTQPTTTSSTSPAVSSPFFGSTYTSRTTSAASNAESSADVGAIVGAACGGLAALVAIVTATIFLKKRKSRHTKLEESRRPNPFLPASILTPGQVVSLLVQPPTNEKTHMRLAARNAVVYQPRRQSDDGSSDFHIPSTADNTERAPVAEARSSITGPFSLDDLVIDCRREDSSPRDSAVRETPPQTVVIVIVDSAPPGYRSLEG